MTTRRVVLRFGELTMPVDLVEGRDGTVARVGGEEIALTVHALSDGLYAVTRGSRRATVHYASDGTTHHLHLDGQVYTFRRDHPGTARVGGGAAHHQDLGAPMPGLVAHIFVQEGQTVEPGDPLFVVEAMKMEHVVRAPTPGRVARIRTASGRQVEGGAIVVEVEERS